MNPNQIVMGVAYKIVYETGLSYTISAGRWLPSVLQVPITIKLTAAEVKNTTIRPEWVIESYCEDVNKWVLDPIGLMAVDSTFTVESAMKFVSGRKEGTNRIRNLRTGDIIPAALLSKRGIDISG